MFAFHFSHYHPLVWHSLVTIEGRISQDSLYLILGGFFVCFLKNEKIDNLTGKLKDLHTIIFRCGVHNVNQHNYTGVNGKYQNKQMISYYSCLITKTIEVINNTQVTLHYKCTLLTLHSYSFFYINLTVYILLFLLSNKNNDSGGSNFVLDLRQHFCKLRPVSGKRHGDQKPFVLKDLTTCKQQTLV